MNRDILRADPQPDGTYTCQRMTFDTTGTNGLLVSPDERSPVHHPDRSLARGGAGITLLSHQR